MSCTYDINIQYSYNIKYNNTVRGIFENINYALFAYVVVRMAQRELEFGGESIEFFTFSYCT